MKDKLSLTAIAVSVGVVLSVGLVTTQMKVWAAQKPETKRGRPAGEAGDALSRPPKLPTNTTSESIPSPTEYRFDEALRTLESIPQHAGGSPPAPRSRPSTITPGPKQLLAPEVRHPVGPSKESAPSTPQAAPTAVDAVSVSDRWQTARNTPAEGRDGRVVFSEGGGMPTVVCAPLRLCVIELQAGEHLTSAPLIGDSVRWSVDPSNFGPGDLATPMIVLKPKAVALDTNLVITTDRRAYYLRLLSDSHDYVARVSFDYPEESQARWSVALHRQAQSEKQAEYDKGLPTLADSVMTLSTDYSLKGDTAIRPIRVLDDGTHTFIHMNPAVLHREAPALAVLGPDGKPEMVNYRVAGSVYVVDRLFDRGRLILGVGRKARKADIIRGSAKTFWPFSKDPFRAIAAEKEGKPK